MPKPAFNPETAAFRITNGKGFHLTFANGYTASVQFGPGNYCDNRCDFSNEVAYMEGRIANTDSPNAEFLAWDAKGKDTMLAKGWLNAEQILALLNETAALPSCL